MTTHKYQRTFDVGEECAVLVEISSGNLRVRGWDKQQVTVRSTGGQVAIHREGRELKVGPSSAGDLALNVPRLCDLTIRLASGDARLNGISGQVTIESLSGDVVARDLSGDLRMHAISGGVSLRSCHLTGLTIDRISGDCVVETGLEDEGRYRVSSASGGLRLLIPEDQRCTVRTHSLSGRFRCRLPHDIVRHGPSETEALINGGGVEFRVRTTSGDVVVKAAGNLAESVEEATFADDHGAGEPTQAGPQPEGEPFAIYEAEPEQAPDHTPVTARRMEILRSVETGEMTVDEALARLQRLE